MTIASRLRRERLLYVAWLVRHGPVLLLALAHELHRFQDQGPSSLATLQWMLLAQCPALSDLPSPADDEGTLDMTVARCSQRSAFPRTLHGVRSLEGFGMSSSREPSGM